MGGPVMLVAAMPLAPLLLLGLARVPFERRLPPEQSLYQFAGSWLLAVLLLFTTAATKLPSYWLPATPAAALLIGFALDRRDRWLNLAWTGTVVLMSLLAAAFWGSEFWVRLISFASNRSVRLPPTCSSIGSHRNLW